MNSPSVEGPPHVKCKAEGWSEKKASWGEAVIFKRGDGKKEKFNERSRQRKIVAKGVVTLELMTKYNRLGGGAPLSYYKRRKIIGETERGEDLEVIDLNMKSKDRAVTLELFFAKEITCTKKVSRFEKKTNSVLF